MFGKMSFFFLFKGDCIIFQSMNMHSFLEKYDHLSLTSEMFPRTFDGFPSPVGTDLNAFPSAVLSLSPGHIHPHTAHSSHSSRLPAIPHQRLFPAFAKLCPSGHATFSLEFLPHQAPWDWPGVNTYSGMAPGLPQAVSSASGVSGSFALHPTLRVNLSLCMGGVWKGLDGSEERGRS